MSAKTISILIAEDHTIVRDGLVALLEAQPDFRVVAGVASGDEAVARIEAARPDVAVVDIAMPKLTGIEVARKVRDAGLRTAIVLLSMHDQSSFVKAGIEAGISGYVLKTSPTRELIDAVRAAAAGDMFLSPRITHAAVRAQGGPAGAAGGDAAPALTPRDRDVVRLVARGLVSKEIGAELGLSTRTVEVYRAEVMRKLAIHSIPGLVKYALVHHLATLDDVPP